MAPPSQLAVATSAVNRLVKEESSYHKELEQQHARVQKLQGEEGDENAEFTMRQEVRTSQHKRMRETRLCIATHAV
jgi:tubulin-specific chaperone A